MKTGILKLLKERDGYVSGQEICDTFQVSRTAVWKVIHKLEEEGYEIEAVRNKGYRLKAAADVITEAEIASRLTTRWAGRNLIYYPKTDSTNTRARQEANQGAEEGTLIVADCQEMGKGRRGRGWESPEGKNIYMSLVLRPSLSPANASAVTLVMALAAAEGIKNACGLECRIKWPNDLVLGGKKICGILTEMSAELECIHWIVAGIGINVNIDSFPEEIVDTATSLKIEKGGTAGINRSSIIAEIMKSFEKYYESFMETGDLALMLEEYDRNLANKGRRVRVLAPKNSYEGTALGITKTGELLVEMDDGEIRKVLSGEVSVRGIYGYI